MRTFKAAESGFVDPIVVVNLRAERLLKVGPQRAIRVGSQKRRNELAVHFGEISIHSVLQTLASLAEVFWKLNPDVSCRNRTPFRSGALVGVTSPLRWSAASHPGSRESLVDGPTQIGQPAGGRNLCDVARRAP